MAENSRNEEYGAMAVRLGLITQPQVDECLAIQARMREMGIEEPLSDILGKKSYLTQEQTGTVFKALGLGGDGIPGYRLTSLIGQGGMGKVYKAVQTSINRTVAVKILANLAAKDPNFQKRFFEEAKAAGALNHRNIIGAIDSGRANGLCYFVMEYFDGKSLRAVLQKEGPLSEARALDVARQTAEALDYIHGHRMIHRDIKPENLMAGADGAIKLCDFGLAREEQAEQSLTMTGVSVGTPFYMAPEQVRGEKDMDIRADLYSLGATLYHLTTGRHLFQGKTAAETMSLHLTQKVVDPRRHAPGMGADLANVILKLVEKDRTHRYQTPKELIEDLDRLKAGAAPAHARQHAAQRAARSSSRITAARGHRASKPVLPVAFGAAGVVVVLVVAFSGSSSPEAKPQRPLVVTPSPVATPELVVEAPRIDQVREDAAARQYVLAETWYKEGKWSEARGAWNGLLREYEGTDFLKRHRGEVDGRVAQCAVHLEERRKEVDRAMAEISAQAKPGSWKVARDKAVALLSSAGEVDGLVREDLERRIKVFDVEIGAEVALARIREACERARWEEAHGLFNHLQSAHGASVSVRAASSDVARWSAEVHAELAAQKALQAARAAKVKADWDRLVEFLGKIETDHATTRTYRDAKAELAELAAAVQGAIENAAKSGWLEAKRRFEELRSQKKLEEARAVLTAWEQRFRLTEEYRQRGAAAIQVYMKSLENMKEDRARVLFNEAKSYQSKKKWKECLETLALVEKDYSGTKLWRDRQKEIEKIQKECEQILNRALFEIDFESEASRFTSHSWGPQRGRFEFDPGARSGKQAGRVDFDASDGQIAWVECTVPAGFPSTAARLSLWLRNADPGSTITVPMVLSEDGFTDIFFLEIQDVGPDWKQYGAELDAFRWVRGDGGDRKLDRLKIRRIGFSSGGRVGPARSFFVDDLRIEALKE